MIKILLDTHTLLWAWTSPLKLSDKARELILNAANERWVSAVTAFEISQKYRIGKLEVEPSLVHSYHDHLRTFQAQEMPITSKQALCAGSFPSEQREPFDRLLAAQSLLEGLPLVTADPAFGSFGIRTIW